MKKEEKETADRKTETNSPPNGRSPQCSLCGIGGAETPIPPSCSGTCWENELFSSAWAEQQARLAEQPRALPALRGAAFFGARPPTSLSRMHKDADRQAGILPKRGVTCRSVAVAAAGRASTAAGAHCKVQALLPPLVLRGFEFEGAAAGSQACPTGMDFAPWGTMLWLRGMGDTAK